MHFGGTFVELGMWVLELGVFWQMGVSEFVSLMVGVLMNVTLCICVLGFGISFVFIFGWKLVGMNFCN